MTASQTILKMHGPLVSNLGLWFAVLSPLIGLIVGLLGAWIVGRAVSQKALLFAIIPFA